MSLSMPERLYQLLPAFHRLRDDADGEPLRALLGVIERELERIEAETANLYDDWFIETCAEWVVPYIGDLLGTRPIRAIPSAGVSTRAYVANTIAYRRRKGTAVVLEQLATDTTGWRARAVEFFARLATTQATNHVRLVPSATANIRNAAEADLTDSAFDRFARTLEVRRAATRRGRFNIPNVGLYVWRLRSYALGDGEPADEAADFTSARRRGSWWTIHPAGVDAPLFNKPRTEDAITHLADEENVPGPLRRLALASELDGLRDAQRRCAAPPALRFMTDDDPVLRVWVRLAGDADFVEVARDDLYICTFPDTAPLSPMPLRVAIDPVRGRLAVPPSFDVDAIRAQSAYGFSGDMGGGPYDRRAGVRAASRAIAKDVLDDEDDGFFDMGVWQVGVSHLHADDGSDVLFASFRDAVDAWNAVPAGRTGVIVLMDSISDVEPTSPAEPITIEIADGSRLLVVAGRWPLEAIAGAPPGSRARVPGRFEARDIRAHLVHDIVIRGTAPGASPDGGACFIDGALIEGRVTVASGSLGALTIAHSTLVPGASSLMVEAGGNERLQLTLDHAICGSLDIAGPIGSARIVDSVVDSVVASDHGSPDIGVDAPETPLDLARSTFFGPVRALALSATDCIFAGGVEAERRQTGCVRFSYVPPASRVPRRYRCQPDLEAETRIAALRAARPATSPPTAIEEARVRDDAADRIRPIFVSRRYGDPGYAQLELRCATPIRSGAESGAEMGAFEFLKQPQREANLRDALDEYLRFGLEAGVIPVT